MLQSDSYKASISLKAESLGDLNEVLDLIANANGIPLVTKATLSTSIAIETDTLEGLRRILEGIATAVGRSMTEVKVDVKAPADVFGIRRLDPTPMERAISKANEEL